MNTELHPAHPPPHVGVEAHPEPHKGAVCFINNVEATEAVPVPPVVFTHPVPPGVPPAIPFPLKENVVPVKSTAPVHLIIVIHPVGVIVTVFAPGANVV